MNGNGNGGGGVLDFLGGLANKYADYRIQKSVDQERTQSFVVNDPAGAQHLVGPDGRLYSRGTPSTASASLLGNPLVIVAGLAAVAGLVFFALRR